MLIVGLEQCLRRSRWRPWKSLASLPFDHGGYLGQVIPLGARRMGNGHSRKEVIPGEQGPTEEYIHLTEPIKLIRNRRAHVLVDITDEAENITDKVLSQDEFLQAKQRHFITREEFENLKPHEVRKHLKATMKQEDLEQKYGKKLAKKIIKRRELDEHAKVRWSPHEKVAETNIEELSVEDIDVKNRPKVERFHFVNKSIYDMTENEFYGSFFRDRERKFDGLGQKLGELENRILHAKQQDLVSTRKRISPKDYWIRPLYVSPSVEELRALNSMDLKVVMMNEARKAIAERVLNEELWSAFLSRVSEISGRVCIRTLLRFLQIVSKVQIKPKQQVKALVDELHRRRGEFKPKHYVFMFQALSRLRLRDQRLYDDIYEMVLCWPVLRNNFIIKASNAIAKLGATESILLQPLKQVLAKRLEGFSSSDCVRVKAITVLDLFTDEMIVAFLDRCEHHRQHFRHYARHLEIVELYLRLLKEDVYEKLGDATKQFLVEVRVGTLAKKISTGSGSGDLQDSQGLPDSTAEESDSRWYQLERPLGIDDAGQEGNEDGSTVTGEARSSISRCQAGETFQCKYHQDISGVLNAMGIGHRNFMQAGPFVLDIYEPLSNTVIEINNEHQYYHGTTMLTAMAKRRHEIISAMGFRLLHIPYRWWRQLEREDQKIEALNRLLEFTV